MALGLGTFTSNGSEPFPGLVVDDQVFDLRTSFGDDATTLSLLERWNGDLGCLESLAAQGVGRSMPLSTLAAKAPIAARQILCAGANYTRHVSQMAFAALKREAPSVADERLREQALRIAEELKDGQPFIFAGLPSAVTGANDDIVLWGPGEQHDWELELAVVIGRGGRHIARDLAMQHVAGYTVSNDISTRDMLVRPGFPMSDLLMTKSRPTFFPTGPYIVPRDRIDNYHDLRIKLSVNGEVMQDESVQDLMHDIDKLVAYASSSFELLPGDLLLTGSPAGNAGHHGNRWLRPGDVIEGIIEGVGAHRNRCVAPPT